jgi:hypothetical protein
LLSKSFIYSHFENYLEGQIDFTSTRRVDLHAPGGDDDVDDEAVAQEGHQGDEAVEDRQ